jgi:hypothetical protein
MLELLPTDSADPAVRREIQKWRLLTAVADNPAERRVTDLENALQAVRSSARFKVGNELAKAASDLRRNGPRAARNLASLWRAQRNGAKRQRLPSV